MSAAGEPAPRLTVAIPLFRSECHVERIAENIRIARGEVPDIEIIVSDRHQEDEAVQLLQRRLGDDRRIRFLTASDRIGWVDNYNALLEIAQGQYFMWMPHDDVFPSGYLTRLCRCLDSNPDAVLAFGELQVEVEPGSIPPTRPFTVPPLFQQPWTPINLLKLAVFWNLAIPFRGVFRRAPVVERGLYIKHSNGDLDADRFWMFGLGLLGRMCFVPGTHCLKHFHAGNTHTKWHYGMSFVFDQVRMPAAYMRAVDRPRGAVRLIYGCGFLVGALWSLFRLSGLRMPVFLRTAINRLALD